MIQPTFIIPPRDPAPAPAAAPPPPSVPGPAPSDSYETLVAEYRATRDNVKTIEAAVAEKLKPLKERLAKIEAQFLDELNRTGANSINTNSGTAYRSTRTSYTVDDPESFRQWVAKNNRPEFFENRPSKEAVEEWLKNGNALPPGVKVSSFTTVNIRK